ncbi:MAG: tetratricopeptide repeat protein [Deltaproteobacteria bacterium]|nr:tetratricopeptide repeat protein [Deltaproteobacteria bacterium]
MDRENTASEASGVEELVARLVLEAGSLEVVGEIERRIDTREGWIEVLTRCADLAPSAPPASRRELCLQLGSWYLVKVQSPRFAASCFDWVLGLDPEDPRALRGMVAACTEIGDPARLEAALAAAAERHPSPIERASAWIALGQIAASRGAEEAAESALRAALSVAPAYRPAHEALAQHLTASGRAGEARDALTELAFLPAAPATRSAVWIEIARLSEGLEDATAAADAYRQALILDPQSEIAARGVDRHGASGAGREDTIGLFEAELEGNRSERERIGLRYRLAALHEAAGAFDDATRVLEEIVARAPDERRATSELARLYRARSAWRKLAETTLRQTEQARDREERVGLFLVAADLYATHLDATPQAIELSREALAIAPDDAQALDALARYSEKCGDHDRALDALDRCRRVTPRLSRRASLWMRTADILSARGDCAGEQDALRQATRDDPHLREAHDRLAAHRRSDGDAEGAARHLAAAADLSEGIERATRLADLAAVELGELSLAEAAAEHLAEAATLRPDDLILAERVVCAQFEAGRPEAARPQLVKLTEAVGDRRGERAWKLWSQLARAHRAAGDSWQELAALRRAFDADPRRPETTVALADLYSASGDHESAAPLYERAWAQVEGSPKGEIALKAAAARQEHGDDVRAATWYRRALEADPQCLDAMIGVARSHRQRCEWRRAADLEEQIAERQEGAERVATLVELADLCEHHLRDGARAARLLAAAIEMGGGSRPLLVRLLGLQSASGSFREALDTLDRLDQIEDDRIVAARVNVTRARILRDELRNVHGAAAAFERALDLDPRDAAGAFNELCALWAQRSRDDEVAGAYRRMIDRLSDDPDRRRMLCDELGSLFRDEMGDHAGAYAAYTEAMALDPGNLARLGIMADLAERLGNHEDAVALHQRLVRRPPAPPTSLRALRRIHAAIGDVVGASWAAAALVVLDEADEDDLLAFAATRDEVRPPQGLLAEADWLGQLIHPDADPRVGKLLQIVAPAVHAVRAAPGEEFAIAGERPLPPSLEAMFGWASSMLGIGRPVVRSCGGASAPDGIGLLFARVPVSIVGPIEARHRTEDCAFLIGHHLASYRAEHFLARLVPDPNELCAIALAAAKIVDSRLRAPIELTERVAAWAERLYLGLDPEARSRLSRVVPLLDVPVDVPLVAKWLRGAELTAVRAGLLTSSDLCAAARQVRRLHASDPHLRDAALQDLVAFAASNEHLALRARLGQRTVAPRPSRPPVGTSRSRKATPRPTSNAAM